MLWMSAGVRGIVLLGRGRGGAIGWVYGHGPTDGDPSRGVSTGARPLYAPCRSPARARIIQPASVRRRPPGGDQASRYRSTARTRRLSSSDGGMPSLLKMLLMYLLTTFSVMNS